MPYMPITDLEVKCLACGKTYKWDTVMGWGCLTLMDDRFLPANLWGVWCDEACFNRWLDSPQRADLFKD